MFHIQYAINLSQATVHLTSDMIYTKVKLSCEKYDW